MSRAFSAACTVLPRARRRRTSPRPGAGVGRRDALGAPGPTTARRRVGRRCRRLVGDVLERTAPRRGRPAKRPTCWIRRTLLECRTWRPGSPIPRDRWWRCPTSCAPCRIRFPGGCPTDYTSLGTDGFGFADTRGAARRFFHVDAESIVLAVLTALAKRGEVKPEAPREAIDRYKLLDVTAAGVGTVGGDA